MTAQQGNLQTQRISLGKGKKAPKLIDVLRRATLGEYEIFTELGRGGMATVYLAHDIALDRKVAIKVMSPELAMMGDDVVKRFQREARTAAALSHPHIIPIYSVRDTDELGFFVMKFVKGRPLESIVREEGRLPVGVTRTILNQVGSALGYAHRHGVIHRDVKPGNIMLDEEGWAVVTDFGIAKAAEAEGLTMTGVAIGTPSYMSPEQCTAEELTGAADQYSLGVVAYEMLTGKLPFEGESAMTIMYMHTHEPPPPLFEQWPDCPRQVSDAVMRMLAKDPKERWPTLEEAIAAIGFAPAQDETNRTQMMTMAKNAGNQAILAQFQTPRSPVPSKIQTAKRKSLGRKKLSSSEQLEDTDTGPAVKRGVRWVVWAAPTALVAVAVGWFMVGPGRTPVEPTASPAEPARVAAGPVAVAIRLDQPPVLDVGGSVQLTQAVVDSSGVALSGMTIRWETDAAQIASVSLSGVVTGVSAGTARITARHETHSASVSVTVRAPVVAEPTPRRPTPRPTPTPPTVAAVNVSPATTRVSVGGTTQLNATARDASGNAVSGRSVAWVSNNTQVATVSSDGRVTGSSPGDARIQATIDGVTATANVTVTPVAVASVTIGPPGGQMTVGEQLTLTAVTRGVDGTALSGRPVSWAPSNGFVRVNAQGVVTAVSPGRVTVTATSESQSASVTITVNAAPPARPDSAADRREIARIIQAYGDALESENIGRLRLVHPSITRQEVDSWSRFFDTVRDLSVRLTINDVEITGDAARVVVDMVQEYRTDRRASQSGRFVANLERTATGWRLSRVGNLPFPEKP
ncbi:MAG: protein kinase [Gemmatimonadetes bacterium]|nr:protein kinase [Gemmatimonadota bacterium]